MKKLCFALLITMTGVCVINYALYFDTKSIQDELIIVLQLVIIALFYNKLNTLITKLEDFLKASDKLEKEFTGLSAIYLDKTLSGRILHAQNLIHEITESYTHNMKIVEGLNAQKQNVSGTISLHRDRLHTSLKQLEVHFNKADSLAKEKEWLYENIEKFVHILKLKYVNDAEFYDSILFSLVKYLDANQGGMFLVVEDEGERYLDLVSCYAYQKKKFMEKRLEIGNTLVGEAYLGNDTILVKDVPQGYISITSGLGESTPSHILIVPFSFNGTVECIVEIASFKAFQEYQIKFVEKIGENVASTLSSMKISQVTQKLLADAQENASILSNQEEEIRQNMEELTATQEDMVRKEKELESLLEESNLQKHSLNDKVFEIERLKDATSIESKKMLDALEKNRKDVIEILNAIPAKIFLKDSHGYIVLCNNEVARAYNLVAEELIGTHDKDFFDAKQVEQFRSQEVEVMNTGKMTYLQEERLNEKTRYLQTTKMPFYIHHLDETGLLGYQFDVTDSMTRSKVTEDTH